MKHIRSSLFFFAIMMWFCIMPAQTVEQAGVISLNPYIPESEQLDNETQSTLNSKLIQIATANGMSGAGFDNRFIITAHLQHIQSTQTQTYPQKNAVVVDIGIYVGDGIDGTLFSSYVCKKKGIGDTEAQALTAAIRKINSNDTQLQMAIDRGKKQILEYYDRMSGSIIISAKSAAANGKYEEAISMLYAIPMYNSKFSMSQDLIAQYGRMMLDIKNMEIIRNARSAWSSDPTENGAAAALKLLEQMDTPSTKAQAEALKLQNEMASRLKAVSDREFKLKMKQVQDAKETRMATINATASVAKAFVSSRPRPIYRYLWW